MQDKQINVECHGATILRLGQLQEFQGELKDLSQTNYERLKKSILENGFSFVFHVWKEGDKYFILDGHQRYRTLKEMQREGFTIPPLPVAWVQAKSYREAKRKLLAGASQYGEVTSQGLYEQATEAGFSADELAAACHFPEINFDRYKREFYDYEVPEETEEPEDKPCPGITCPKCGYNWTPGTNPRKGKRSN